MIKKYGQVVDDTGLEAEAMKVYEKTLKETGVGDVTWLSQEQWFTIFRKMPRSDQAAAR